MVNAHRFPQCKSFETWGMTDAHNSFVTKGADLAAPGAFYYNKWHALPLPLHDVRALLPGEVRPEGVSSYMTKVHPSYFMVCVGYS